MARKLSKPDPATDPDIQRPADKVSPRTSRLCSLLPTTHTPRALRRS